MDPSAYKQHHFSRTHEISAGHGLMHHPRRPLHSLINSNDNTKIFMHTSVSAQNPLTLPKPSRQERAACLYRHVSEIIGCLDRVPAVPALPWLPHLQELILQDNEISSIDPMLGCPQLTALNLSFNAIADLDSIASISPCTTLRSLCLHDNPVVDLPGYADMRLQVRPSLAALSCLAGCSSLCTCNSQRRYQGTMAYLCQCQCSNQLPIALIITCPEQSKLGRADP